MTVRDTLLTTEYERKGMLVNIPFEAFYFTRSFFTNYDIKQICNKFANGTCKGKIDDDITTCELVHVDPDYINKLRHEIVKQNNVLVRFHMTNYVRAYISQDICKKLNNLQFLNFLTRDVSVTNGLEIYEKQIEYDNNKIVYLCEDFLVGLCLNGYECNGIHVMELNKLIRHHDRWKNFNCERGGNCTFCKKLQWNTPQKIAKVILDHVKFKYMHQMSQHFEFAFMYPIEYQFFTITAGADDDRIVTDNIHIPVNTPMPVKAPGLVDAPGPIDAQDDEATDLKVLCDEMLHLLGI